MSVYDSARKLADEIKDSKEYKAFYKSMKVIKDDKNSEKLLKEYKLNQMNLQRIQLNNNLNKDIEKNMNSIQLKIKKNKKVYNYLKNEENFIKMMNNINVILSESVENDYK
ncbi:MAG: YlbF family regulator [Peptostreptococcaceae bacterium]